jgi:hypothetical protein
MGKKVRIQLAPKDRDWLEALITPAQRGDALFATKTFKDNAYLLFLRTAEQK